MKFAKSPITIQDVATAAGVSVSTVSRVLNDKVDVAPETFEKVQRVIEELGYTSSLAAKSMRSRKTNVIGLVLHDLEQSFCLNVVRGVNRAIEQMDYDLLVYTGGNSRDRSWAVRERQYVSLLNGSITDGIIVVTPTAETFSTHYPLVAVDPHLDSADFPAVIATNHVGALAAMEYLLGLGHRRIGFIGGRPDLQSAVRRLQGYQDSLRQANIPLDPDLIQIGDFTQETGYRCAQKLLALPVRPTAIFAANDKSAIGAIEAITEIGLKVPEDISVVGFDNIEEASFVNGGLTTVDQFISDMGRVAVEMLINLIQNQPLENRLFRMPTKLIVRNTCRALEPEN
ncbi:MAG: LacI family transcriptional regulator [Anaerolineae bacterium]|nr:LacI family DNA-binding transcriptional regulator [Anaerolineales bacterium]MCQ3975557.1 LacI family transcriptional regulator [Anaerolineae bacterium]